MANCILLVSHCKNETHTKRQAQNYNKNITHITWEQDFFSSCVAAYVSINPHIWHLKMVPSFSAMSAMCFNTPSYHHRCWLFNCVLLSSQMAPLFSTEDTYHSWHSWGIVHQARGQLQTSYQSISSEPGPKEHDSISKTSCMFYFAA